MAKTKLKTFIDSEQLAKDLKFSQRDLSDAFVDQSALFAFYSQKAIEAQFQLDYRKTALEIVTSSIDKEIRDAAALDNEKLTEGKITSRIHTDRRYVEALMTVNEAKQIAGLCRVAPDAFSQRKDMLIQAGAASRKEAEGSLRMRGSMNDVIEAGLQKHADKTA